MNSETSTNPSPPPEPRPPWPERIGKYIVLGEIGEGGMGKVYEAFNPDLAGPVAIKVPNPASLGSLVPEDVRREAMLLHSASGPHVARILDAGVYIGPHGPTPFIVTEYLQGSHHLNSTVVTSLGLREVVRIFRDAAAGVASLHASEIIHADLKPSNILVVYEAKTWTAKVIDFGLAAKLRGREARVHGGTAPYMAPELVESDVLRCTKASDVYALGATLYELLVGKVPERRGSDWLVEPPSRLNPFVDRRLDRIVLRCLERQPDRRYPDAAALLADLDAWLGSIRAGAGCVLRRSLAFQPALTMLAIVAGVCVISVLAAEPLLASSARAQALFEPLFGALPIPACPPKTVCIVGYTDDAKLQRVAETLDIKDIDLKRPATLRRLHTALAGKLTGAGARVLCWDLWFESPSPFDADLRAAMEAAADAGIPVVVAVRTWRLNENREPALCPELLASTKLRWGPGTASFGEEGSVLDALAVESRTLRPIASMAIQTVAAARVRSMLPVLTFESDRGITIAYRERDRPNASVPEWSDRTDRLLVTQIAPGPGRERTDIEPDARVAELVVPFPQAEDWARQTFDLADVLLMDPAQLQAFRGKIVLIGELRDGRDEVVYKGRGKTHGVVFQAQAIEQINQGAIKRVPHELEQWGVLVASGVLGVVVSFCAFAMFRPARPERGSGVLIAAVSAAAAIVGVLAACLVAYRCTPVEILPAIPTVAVVLASAAASWALIRRSVYLRAAGYPH